MWACYAFVALARKFFAGNCITHCSCIYPWDFHCKVPFIIIFSKSKSLMKDVSWAMYRFELMSFS